MRQTVSGKWIGAAINGNFVDCETECSLSFDAEMIPSASEESGGWDEFVAGYKNWKMSVNGKLLLNTSNMDFKKLYEMYTNGTKFAIAIKTKKDGSLGFFGWGFVSSGTLNAATNQKANWTLEIQGSGSLLMISDPFQALIINAMPAPADKPNIVNTTNW